MGDYNINLLNSDSHHPTGEFLDILYSNMLCPLITRPTRVTQGALVTDISDHYPVFHLSGQYVTYIANDYCIMISYNARNKNSALLRLIWIGK